MVKSNLNKAKSVLKWLSYQRDIRYPSKFCEHVAINTYLLFHHEGKGKYRGLSQKEIKILAEIYDYHLASRVVSPPARPSDRQAIHNAFRKAANRFKK